jgi:hypothetical protein
MNVKYFILEFERFAKDIDDCGANRSTSRAIKFTMILVDYGSMFFDVESESSFES